MCTTTWSCNSSVLLPQISGPAIAGSLMKGKSTLLLLYTTSRRQCQPTQVMAQPYNCHAVKDRL